MVVIREITEEGAHAGRGVALQGEGGEVLRPGDRQGSDGALDLGDRSGVHAELAHTETDEQRGRSRVGGDLATVPGDALHPVAAERPQPAHPAPHRNSGARETVQYRT